MSDPSSFIDAVQRFDDLIQAAAALPLPARIEAVQAHLVHLYAGGQRLTASDAAPLVAPPRPWPADWPGLGPLDAQQPAVSTLVHGVHSDLTRGLHDGVSPASAQRWWKDRFQDRWGTLVVAALPVLHRALVQARAAGQVHVPADPIVPADTPTPAPLALAPAPDATLPQFEPSPPTRVASGRQRVAVDVSRGVLGLRFTPDPDGLVVRDVHPRGPAASVLIPGDVLLKVDGLPLAGRSDAEAAAAMAGAPGIARTVHARRGDQTFEAKLTPVEAQTLAPVAERLSLLILDRDAADRLLGGLEALGVTLEPSPDQEGLTDLIAPPGVAGALRLTLAEGQAQGLWELLP